MPESKNPMEMLNAIQHHAEELYCIHDMTDDEFPQIPTYSDQREALFNKIFGGITDLKSLIKQLMIIEKAKQ